MRPGLYDHWCNLSNAYLNTYPFAAIICMLFYCILKNKWKHEMKNWLYVFNSVVLWFTFINLFLLLAELFMTWYGQNQYEWHAFKGNNEHVYSSYSLSYWLLVLMNILLPQLFWFKKLRKSIIITMLVVFFTGFGIWFERLVIYITAVYRDYLPSSWATYNKHQNLIFTGFVQAACFMVISVIVYLVFYKRNKLPLTSVFLK